MIALVTQNAWFRMPPARHEYLGPELIGAFLAAVFEGHSSQTSRLIATRANGQPAFGTYYIDPVSGLPRHSGLLVLLIAGARIAELFWFLGSGYLKPFDLPGAPFSDVPVSKAP
jgi:RNA polymerase sigma-70 factor (ECF subfamily)